MDIAILKYNAGNIQSVLFALERRGIKAHLTNCPDELSRADKIIFPGQGSARAAMDYLVENGLDDVIRSFNKPFLGICVGLQLMCQHSEEGDVPCLGIFDLSVKRFRPLERADKVPHIGWNEIEACQSPILNGLEGEHLYYVHSYYAEIGQGTSATTDYIHPFSAAIQKDNFFALQAHLEKSGSVGDTILKNFLAL